MIAAIIGAGELGHALGKLCDAKGITVRFWDKNPEQSGNQASIEDTVRATTYALFAVPSSALREAVTAAIPFLEPTTVVLSFSKGLEVGSLKTTDEVLAEILPPGAPYAVVGGPMLAEEIIEGKSATGVFASRDTNVLEKIRRDLSSPEFGVETSTDPFSVSIASVLKNIYAIAAGITDGLALGDNVKSDVITQAQKEMAGIATALGASPNVMAGTAGSADLIATSYSPHSRNRETGDEIAKHGAANLKSEGLVSLPSLLGRLGTSVASFPLLTLIKEICIGGTPAGTVFAERMRIIIGS